MGFFARPALPLPTPPSPSHALILLYVAHTLLEVVLGAMKLRGRYQHEAPGSRSARSEMYARHHGFSLLALALLGGLVWWHNMIDTPTGQGASAVLALFHGGAVAAFLQTYAVGAIPLTKVVVPHLPFAVGFALHAFR